MAVVCSQTLVLQKSSFKVDVSAVGEKGHLQVPVTICVSFVELWACKSQVQALPGPFFTSRGPNPGQQVTQFGNVKHHHLVL